MSKPAVFIDRDGTLSDEIGYINHASRFRMLPNSPAAIRKLNEAGIPAVLVTNQAGVARGYFPEERIGEVHERMNEILKQEDAHLDGVYYCPHHPTAGDPPYRADCDCRKPRTGLIDRAATDLDLDLAKSYMIGDKFSDVKLGQVIGGKGILVLTGYGIGQWEYDRQKENVTPDHVAKDLLDAVAWILEDMKINSKQ